MAEFIVTFDVPGAAVRDGAAPLVVGRPILETGDPGAAARAILQEMRA